MSAIFAAMAARFHSAAGAEPTVLSDCLLAALHSASAAPEPSGLAPLWAPAAPEAAPAAAQEAAWAAAEEEAAGQAAVRHEAAEEEARAPEVLVVPMAGVAVEAVQVQQWLHLITKKSRDWVVFQATFSPRLGVAWQTKTAITNKGTLGRVEKFGDLPPALAMALLEQGMAWGLQFFGG